MPVASTLQPRLLRGARDLARIQPSADRVGLIVLQGQHVLTAGAVAEDRAQASESNEGWARSGCVGDARAEAVQRDAGLQRLCFVARRTT